jgi:hypothetical protein
MNKLSKKITLLLSLIPYLQTFSLCFELYIQAPYTKIVAIGDSRVTQIFQLQEKRTSNIYHNHIVRLVKIVNPNIILFSGDLVEDGANKEDWKMFEKYFGVFIKSIKLFPALGNRELDTNFQKGLKNYFNTFTYLQQKRWYCIYLNKKILFVFLDSNFHLLNTQEKEFQNKFLNQTLKSYKNKFSLAIVIFHHSLYRSLLTFTYAPWYFENFKKQFDNIDKPILFINGHFHNFYFREMEKKNQYYLLTAGGGANIPYWGPKFLNKHHFVIITLAKNNIVKIKVFVLKSPKTFYIKKITEFPF